MLSERDRRVLQEMELDLAGGTAGRWPARAARRLRLPAVVAGLLAVGCLSAVPVLPSVVGVLLVAVLAGTLGWQLRLRYVQRRRFPLTTRWRLRVSAIRRALR